MKYNVWVTLFGSSAANAGIIGGVQKSRSSWANGKLEYVPVNDGSQVNFQFEARNDVAAFDTTVKMFNASRPMNRKPISGKSLHAGLQG